jgi:hypothetical protein
VFDTRFASGRNAPLQKSKEQVSRVTRLLSISESGAEFKTTCLQFHLIVLWLVGVKVHDDLLCCHHPPATERGGFYLNVCDRGFDSLVDACSCLMPESYHEASDEYKGGNPYEDE